MQSLTLNIKSPAKAFQFFQLARFASVLITSILLTKSKLSQPDIGIYETILLVSGAFSIFWVNAVLNTFLPAYEKSDNKPKIIFNTGVLLFTITLLFTGIIILGINQINTFFGIALNAYAMKLFYVYFIFSNLAYFTEYILLAKKEIKSLISLGIFHLVFQTSLIAFAAFNAGNIYEVILFLTIFIFIKCSYLLLLLIKNTYFKIDLSLIKKQILLIAPLALSYLLGGFSLYADGIIVTHYYDKSTFAMYQYGAREFPISLLIASSFSSAMSIVIATNIKAGLSEIKKGSLELMHILFPVSIALIISSRWLYPIVFNSNFSNSFIYFNIYLLLLIPRIIFPQTICIATGKTKLLMYISAIELLVNIISSIVLMHYIGLAGIAFGTLIAYIFEKTILVYYLQKEKIDYKTYIPVKQLLIYSVLLILAFCITTLPQIP